MQLDKKRMKSSTAEWLKNDVEDGKESAPKSVDDSENASDASEYILGSELKW